MEMQLQSLAPKCFISGQPFTEGQRVASFLIRGTTEEVVRYDLNEAEVEKFAVEGTVACRWVQVFKHRKANENPERDLKLNTETLFVALADPANEPSIENTRLLQFMALMLERKRVLRPKGRTSDGLRNIFEHAKTKQLFEVEAGELSPEFFIQVQQQLSVLVGEPKKATSATK
jgi:hypothetical protein